MHHILIADLKVVFLHVVLIVDDGVDIEDLINVTQLRLELLLDLLSGLLIKEINIQVLFLFLKVLQDQPDTLHSEWADLSH